MAHSILLSERVGGRRRVALAVVAWIGFVGACASSVGPARAADTLSVRAGISERVQADDNIRLESDSRGWVFGSTTSLDVDVDSKTPVLDINLRLGADYNRFWGPGASSDLNSLDWLTSLGVEKRYIRTLLGARATHRRQAVRESELEDTGQTVGDAERVTTEAALSAAYDVSSVDRAEVVLDGRYVTFEDAEDNLLLNPYYATSLATQWARKLNERETGTARAGFVYFDSENMADTTSQSFTVGGLYEYQATPRLRLLAGAGIGAVNQQRDVANRGRVSTLSPALSFELAANYVLERTTLDVSITQDVEPSAGGELRQHREVRASLGHETSPTTSVHLVAMNISQGTDIGLSPIEDFERDYTSIEARLSWRIYPDLRLDTGYRFRYEDDQTGTGLSHAVFAGLRYGFTLLP